MCCGLSGLLPSLLSPAEPSSSVRREEGLQQQCEGTLRVHAVFSMFEELLEEGLQKCLLRGWAKGWWIEKHESPRDPAAGRRFPCRLPPSGVRCQLTQEPACSHLLPLTSLLGALQTMGHREAITAFLPAFQPFEQNEDGERQVLAVEGEFSESAVLSPSWSADNPVPRLGPPMVTVPPGKPRSMARLLSGSAIGIQLQVGGREGWSREEAGEDIAPGREMMQSRSGGTGRAHLPVRRQLPCQRFLAARPGCEAGRRPERCSTSGISFWNNTHGYGILLCPQAG
ncbi:uncharacterized protein ACIBXB_010391 [Morphnus guianensis]